MVFNTGMDTPNEHPDWKLILSMGGPVKVAQLLGYAKEGGAQRVQNWKYRGIPPAVKVEHPKLFMRRSAAAPRSPTDHPGERATDRAPPT